VATDKVRRPAAHRSAWVDSEAEKRLGAAVFDGGDIALAAGDGNCGVLQHKGNEGKVRGCSFDGRRLGGAAHRDGAETAAEI
jgi:hypothetical protein